VRDRDALMAIISFRSDEIHCKVVYYGPGRGGKTTNLITIHKALGDQVRGELLSIDTSGDRTLFFDFLPMDLGSIGKFRIKISLYTVPGQVRYNDTRKLVLKGVDGIVFVADSLEARRHNNVESFQNLEENLKEQGKSISALPVVVQYNKRDLAGSKVAIIPVEDMDRDLNPHGQLPCFSASALRGDGVRETFKKVCMMTVVDVSTRLLKDKGMSLTGS
jgi:signal recognition particle receptor subunit beta